MNANVGGADKVIRIVVGLGLIGWGIYAKNWLGAIGIVPLITAVMNWCPLYTVCGASTCGTKSAAK